MILFVTTADTDLLTATEDEIAAARVQATIVGGRIVYRAAD